MARRPRNSASDEGCDDLGGRPPVLFAFRRRPHRPCPRGVQRSRRRSPGIGHQHHHAAAGAQHLPQFEPQLRPQDPRSRAGGRTGDEVLQGRDPRTLSQQGLFRRRCLWRGFGQPPLFQPPRDRAFDRRGGDHCRSGQGTQPLFPDRRCGRRRRPCECRAAPDARTGPHIQQRSVGRSVHREAEGRAQPEFRAVLHRLGAAAAGHIAARNLRSDRSLDHAGCGHAARSGGGDHRQHAAGHAGRARQHGR